MSVISATVPGFRVAEYENYPFDSACMFGGDHLALGSDGVYLLDGYTDAGATISSSVLTGVTTFDSPNYKRINDVFAAVRCASGTVSFMAVANEKLLRTSSSSHPNSPALRQVRFMVNKNYGRVKARAWQFGMSNENGSDFTLFDLSLTVHPLSRSER